MTDSKMTYKALMALVFVLMLAGCSDDIEQAEKRVLSLVPYVSSYSDASQAKNARTRAKSAPTGYEAFTPAASYGSIKIFLAHQVNSQWVNSIGEFSYSESKWQSTANVEKSTQYYVYGYMPAGSATATISSSDYSTGATLTLSGLNVLNPVDVCAIVGVKKDSEEGDLTPGQYSYLTDATGNDKQLYLLLEHIYSKVDFLFAIDEDYSKLRTIKLKSVKMGLSSATSKMKATITLYKNKDLPMSCTYAYDGGETVSSVALFSAATTTEEKTLSTDYQSVPGYLLPGNDQLSFNLTSTYDVYDKKGNCVRPNCSATNKITITAAKAGYNYKIKLLVKPTYLYQLSEPDLDNPTIVTGT